TVTVSQTQNGVTCISPPATRLVTVLDNPVLSVSANPAEVCRGEDTELSVSGAGTYTWSNLSNATTQQVSPTKTQHYIVTGTDNNSCQSTQSVQVVVALCMGVDELKTENLTINVYPNPTNGEFTVESPDNTHLIIMNATGQIVLEQTSTSNKTEISLGNFANGIYFVKAGSVVKKVVKE